MMHRRRVPGVHGHHPRGRHVVPPIRRVGKAARGVAIRWVPGRGLEEPRMHGVVRLRWRRVLAGIPTVDGGGALPGLRSAAATAAAGLLLVPSGLVDPARVVGRGVVRVGEGRHECCVVFVDVVSGSCAPCGYATTLGVALSLVAFALASSCSC